MKFKTVLKLHKMITKPSTAEGVVAAWGLVYTHFSKDMTEVQVCTLRNSAIKKLERVDYE